MGGKYGFLNTKYREIIPAIYDSVGSFNKGIAKVSTGGKWGWIDVNGNEITPAKYDEVGEWADGIATVKADGKWGCLDAKYDEIIPAIYEEIGSFVDGITWVRLDGKCGLIDKTGRGITAPKYDNIGGFEDGLALVSLEGVYGYINRTGAEVIPLIYSAEEAPEYKKDYVYYQKFSNFANEYMADKVKAFETKDEFETEAQYTARVNEESLAKLKAELTKEAEEAFIQKRSSSVVLQLTIGTYDAENQTFVVADLNYGQFIVEVPLNVARDFKALWDGIVKTPKFVVKDDALTVDGITFRMPDGQEFTTK